MLDLVTHDDALTALPAGEIYIDTALPRVTSGSAGSPKTAMRR
jgi:hypothetical protein